MSVCLSVIVSCINTGSCIAWRQTEGCDPDGPRESANDKDCATPINDGWSGYCECAQGIQKMRKGCVTGHFQTCSDACDSGK